MPTAGDISRSVSDAIRGFSLGPEWRYPWDPENIIGGPGSENIPKLLAANEAAYQRTRHAGLFDAVMDAWIGYAEDFPLHGNEPCSCFVYGDWNTWADLVALRMALVAGRQDVVEALRRVCLNQWLIQCLCSAWRVDDGLRFRGRRNVLTGARSWVTAKVDDQYFDEHGIYLPPYESLTGGDNQHGNHVAYSLGEAPAVEQLGSVEAASRAATSGGLFTWLNPSEIHDGRSCANLGKSGELSAEDLWTLSRVGDALLAGPRPVKPLRVIVTDQCRAAFCEQSTNPGSTCFLYAKVWYASGRPAGWWNRYPWHTDPYVTWLHADPPARNVGSSGRAELVELAGARLIRAQRDDGTYYDVPTNRYVAGWNEVPVPGRLLLDLRISRAGVEFVHLEGGDGQVGGGGGGQGDDEPTPRQLVVRSQDRLNGLLEDWTGPNTRPEPSALTPAIKDLRRARRLLREED